MFIVEKAVKIRTGKELEFAEDSSICYCRNIHTGKEFKKEFYIMDLHFWEQNAFGAKDCNGYIPVITFNEYKLINSLKYRKTILLSNIGTSKEVEPKFRDGLWGDFSWGIWGDYDDQPSNIAKYIFQYKNKVVKVKDRYLYLIVNAAKIPSKEVTYQVYSIEDMATFSKCLLLS